MRATTELSISTTIVVILFKTFVEIIKISAIVIKEEAVLLYRICRFIWSCFHYRKCCYSEKEVIKIIRKMSPRQFEIFVAELYATMNYDVELTAATADGGKDVILYGMDETVYVECKHYAEGNYVGREICQKLLGSMYVDNIDRGIIVTTGCFNDNAWEVYNKVDNLQFVDMKGLMKIVNKIKIPKLQRIMIKTLNSRK